MLTPGGAVCRYCGKTWYNDQAVEFRTLANGAAFVLAESHEDTVWVKAENESDFPSGRNHRYNNKYQADQPDLQGMCGLSVMVVLVEVKI